MSGRILLRGLYDGPIQLCGAGFEQEETEKGLKAMEHPKQYFLFLWLLLIWGVLSISNQHPF